MNSHDKERVKKITNKILIYNIKKREYLKHDDIDNAAICSHIISLLEDKRQDIIEGIEKDMKKRKDELLRKRDALQEVLESVGLSDKSKIKKELFKINGELQEEKLREYARKVKEEKRKVKRKVR